MGRIRLWDSCVNSKPLTVRCPTKLQGNRWRATPYSGYQGRKSCNLLLRMDKAQLTELLIVWRLWSQKSVVCSPSNLLKRQSSTSRPKLVACVIWDLLEHKPKFRTSCISLLYLRYESYANSVKDKNSLRKWLFGVGRVFLSRVFIKRVKLVSHAKPLQITDSFNHPIDWGRKRNTWYFMGYTFLLLEAKRTHFPLDEIQ